MLRKIPYLREAAEIVYSHQEHFNGSGYPRGLRGKEIPLGARIFAVADALDAITSDRPYRSATSFATARKEIRKNTGTQFDPQVVEVFLQCRTGYGRTCGRKFRGRRRSSTLFAGRGETSVAPQRRPPGKNGILTTMPETKKSGASGRRGVEGGGCETAWLARGTRRIDTHLQLSEFRRRAGVCAVTGCGSRTGTAPPRLDIRYSKVKVRW